MLTVAASSLAAAAVVQLYEDEKAFCDEFHYLCGRILSTKLVVLPSHSAAVSTAWGLKEKVLIRQEEGGVLLFQFRDREVKDRVLNRGPWFFNNSMIVLADYDSISALNEVPLQLMEMWVAISGLPIKMRIENVVSRIGQRMGEVVRLDPMAVQKDPIQRACVRVDVRRRLLPKRRFDFSPEVSVVVRLEYEKSHGLCMACGFFDHGGGGCDKLVELEALLRKSEKTELEVAPRMAVSEVRSDSGIAPLIHLGTAEPVAAMEDDGGARLKGLEGSAALEGSVVLLGLPKISTGKPSLKLGLTRDGGLTGLVAGPSSCGLVLQPNGFNLLGQESSILAAVMGKESEAVECYVKRKRTIKLTEKALGLIQPPKKKRCKPIGAKSTKPPKELEAIEVESSLVYNGLPSSPGSKGKDKI